MAAKFSLEIKSPEKIIFSGSVESIIVTHSSGKEGYLANHESVVKPIDGPLKYRVDPQGEYESMESASGWLLFSDNKAVIFLTAQSD